MTLDLCITWVLGLCLGSFVTMAGYRLSVGGGSWFRPSACPHCHRRLSVDSLIPLFSWLWQRGKCKFCRQPISIYYPFIELLTAGIFTINYYAFGWSWEGLLVQIISIHLLLLAIVDWQTYTFPDSLQLSLFGCVLVLNYLYGVDLASDGFGNYTLPFVLLGVLLVTGVLQILFGI